MIKGRLKISFQTTFSLHESVGNRRIVYTTD